MGREALGFRLVDAVKDVSEIENSKMQIQSVIYVKKINEKISNGWENINKNLKAQAELYGVQFENYTSRVENIKERYFNEVNKLKEEYSVQFINMQMELRDTCSSKKIALANAKRMLDMKKEYVASINNVLGDYNSAQIFDYQNKIKEYDGNRKKYLEKYYDYSLIITDCEMKLDKCVNDSLEEIEVVINKNIDNSLLVKKEGFFSKFISKISNIFSGKSKFESKIAEAENKFSESNFNYSERVEEIHNNTIELVADIQVKRDNIVA